MFLLYGLFAFVITAYVKVVLIHISADAKHQLN